MDHRLIERQVMQHTTAGVAALDRTAASFERGALNGAAVNGVFYHFSDVICDVLWVKEDGAFTFCLSGSAAGETKIMKIFDGLHVNNQVLCTGVRILFFVVSCSVNRFFVL